MLFYTTWFWLLKPRAVLLGPMDCSHTTSSTCIEFHLLYQKINPGNSNISVLLLAYVLTEEFKEWFCPSEALEVSADFSLRNTRKCLWNRYISILYNCFLKLDLFLCWYCRDIAHKQTSVKIFFSRYSNDEEGEWFEKAEDSCWIALLWIHL